ncbi:hypothetical protein B0H16DRAFT_1897881 [Mycena metata]|uniref:Uncharacterized protein n=1 Tax=Mycena metata TaxID=1033252 RepID=A0AAD7HDM3_9AGAR|nr:hypothetical protein B0H16DRAFT_1897881 [Mycena metata]
MPSDLPFASTGVNQFFFSFLLFPPTPIAMDDAKLLANVTMGHLLEFRSLQFTAAFIDANPVIFANTGWVHPGQLRTFLGSKSLAVSVKTEVPDASCVKPEPSIILLPPRLRPAVPFRTRNLVEGGTDIIEILSSDDEMEVETSPHAALASSDPPEPSSGPSALASSSPAPFDSSDPPQHLELSDDEPEGSAPMALSETEWYNPDIISCVIIGPAEIDRQNKVGRVEYLTEIPSYFPVFREPTAIVIDMRHKKFNFYDTDGVLLEPDTLILDQNQESWSTSSGGGDHHPTCLLFNGTKVKCRRARHTCNGCYRCSELDLSLVNVTRFEIDTSTRAKVISAEVVTRLAEGDTPEKLVAAFHRIVMSRKCKARDHIGAPCDGHPKMIRHINGSLRKAHFIGCSSWSRTWRDHPADSIPDNIDETLLAELMSLQGVFASGSTTAECSRIGSSRVGEHQPFCAHIHLKDGKSVRGQMLHHPCKTYMTIYVPLDSSLRMACVTFNPAKPHTHPMGPMTKITLDVKEAYRKCVRAAGVLGTTVQRVDDAPTTLLLLNGQSPAIYHPSLHRKRLKQGLIRDEKLKISPEGLGVAAIYARHVRDLKLPPEECYIQSVITTPDGRVLIITMVPYLANLVHVARTVQVDTTFGRTVGDLNEWEFVIWYGSVERVLTLGRIYTDGADRPHYKCLFDELQKVILRLTGKNFRFKRFSRGGNLVTMGVDMEAAQVQGACDSFLPTNEPEYSGIITTEPDKFALFFVRACISHCKRGVHKLKPFVDAAVFARLMEFPYMKTDTNVANFTAWITSLNNKKKHKLQYPWILPSLIKSRSRIHAADWDITESSTNLNEGQHHWTNQRTGVKLSPYEAVETARKLDFQTAREVKDSLETGILHNNSNNILHRMGRKVQRSANAAAKSREAGKQLTETEELQAQYEEAKAVKKLSDQLVKDAQVKLSAAKGTTRRKCGVATAAASPLLQATSSGSVITARRPRANSKTVTAPPSAPDIAPSVMADILPAVNDEPPFSGVALIGADPNPLLSNDDFAHFSDAAFWNTFEFHTPPVPQMYGYVSYDNVANSGTIPMDKAPSEASTRRIRSLGSEFIYLLRPAVDQWSHSGEFARRIH